MKPIQFTAILALALAPVLCAQENEVRERIESLRKKAVEAKTAGRFDEAEKFHREAEELRAHVQEATKKTTEEGRRTEIERKTQLEDARVKIDKAYREVAEQKELKARHRVKIEAQGPGAGPDLADAKRRLHHLQAAVENLRAAGLNEPAESLARQAAQMREHLAQASHAEHPAKVKVAREPQMEEMREALGNLQRTVKEMQKQLEELSRNRQ